MKTVTVGNPSAHVLHLAVALVSAGGLCLFALFLHQSMPLRLLSLTGLVLASAGLFHAAFHCTSPRRLFGLTRPSVTVLLWSLPLMALTLAGSVSYRFHLDQSLLPTSITGLAFLALAVGAAEELFFRGYLQERASFWGPLVAVLLPAVLHTAYKTALFLLPAPSASPTHLSLLVPATLVGGIVFGIFRWSSGSVLPPLAAHVLFDLVVYGDRAVVPEWLWN